ncbi:hypothetical protein Mapa_014633 [Marchantia paleacea]|nr:hypothetical protein Mapa_014633 [Marchantia paleacea]
MRVISKPVIVVQWMSVVLLMSSASSSPLKEFFWTKDYRNISLPDSIPKMLTPTADTEFLGVYLGLGHQKFLYDGKKWTWVNATATLYDENNNQVAHLSYTDCNLKESDRPSTCTHAIWVSENPWSSVSARKKIVVPQNDRDAHLILFEAVQASGDEKMFGRVAYVQRLQTYRGLAPRPSQTKGQVFMKGQPSATRYSALYAFYGLKNKTAAA